MIERDRPQLLVVIHPYERFVPHLKHSSLKANHMRSLALCQAINLLGSGLLALAHLKSNSSATIRVTH